MDFGWRFRRPTDATTFVTPNQMSEHARRRDLIKLRHFLSPRRGLGCAWRAPTHNHNIRVNSSTQVFQKMRLTGHHLISNVRNSEAAMFGLRQWGEPDSPSNSCPYVSAINFRCADIHRAPDAERGSPRNYRDQRALATRIVRPLFSSVCRLLQKRKSRQRTIGPA
jgi:hypothetical protein